jgi:hypothetical protein
MGQKRMKLLTSHRGRLVEPGFFQPVGFDEFRWWYLEMMRIVSTPSSLPSVAASRGFL